MIDQNIFYTTKDELFNSEENDTDFLEDTNYSDIFEYKNFCQEYNFITGETKLYKKISKDMYALLFDSYYEGKINNICIYTKDGVFIVNDYDFKNGTIKLLDYFEKTDFINFLVLINTEPKNIIHKHILNTVSIHYLIDNSLRLVMNNHYLSSPDNDAIMKNYRELFVKYQTTTQYIPTIKILESIISDIHKYISTGKIDMYNIEERLSNLSVFKEICPNSYSLVSSFFHNPKSVDLRMFCDKLANQIKKIEYLLNLYLEDELSIQGEIEK